MKKKKKSSNLREVWFWSKADFDRLEALVARLEAAMDRLDATAKVRSQAAKKAALTKRENAAAPAPPPELPPAAPPRDADGLPFPPPEPILERGDYS